MVKVLSGQLEQFTESSGDNIGYKNFTIRVGGSKPYRVRVNKQLINELLSSGGGNVQMSLMGLGMGPIRRGLLAVTLPNGKSKTAPPFAYAPAIIIATLLCIFGFLSYSSSDMKLLGIAFFVFAAWEMYPLIMYQLLPKGGAEKA